GCEGPKVHRHQIALSHQPSHGLSPGVRAAEEFVHPIASVRVGSKVQTGKMAVEISVGCDIARSEPSTKKVKELVGLKTSSSDVRSADQLDTARVSPACAEEIEELLGSARRAEHAKEEEACLRQRLRALRQRLQTISLDDFVKDEGQ